MNDAFPSTLLTDRRFDGVRVVDRPFTFESARLGVTITVPVGFPTDGATVPRWPIVYWLFGNRAEEAAAIHDWLYRQQTTTRAEADAVFRDAMAVCHPPESAWRRLWMWAGVRAAGWIFWRTNRKLGQWMPGSSDSADITFSKASDR